jgi:hypothetical protein
MCSGPRLKTENGELSRPPIIRTDRRRLRSEATYMLTGSYRRHGASVPSWFIMEWIAVAITGLSTWTVGCSASKPPCEPPAEPENTYQTLCEQEDEVVPIEANDLGVPPSAIMEAGRKNLETEPMTGRFPGGLSVVRVEAATRGDEPEHFLRLVPVEDYRKAPWIQVMQALPMVREVTVVGTYGLDPQGTDWRGLLRASLRIDCDFCFIYAEIYETAADAEFVGVLWDAMNEKALATYRVPVVLPPDARLKYEEKKTYVGLKSEAESRAMAEMQQSVRNTIWEVAARDTETTTTQPSPWQTDLPLYPRDYDNNLRIYLKERPRK